MHHRAEGLHTGARVLMHDDFMWVALPKAFDLGYKIVDVGVGPLQLDARTGEYVWH